MKDEEAIIAVDDKRALLRPTQAHEAICGWKGLLAGAVCTTLVLIFGVILVKLLFPTPSRAIQCSDVSLSVLSLIKMYLCSRG